MTLLSSLLFATPAAPVHHSARRIMRDTNPAHAYCSVSPATVSLVYRYIPIERRVTVDMVLGFMREAGEDVSRKQVARALQFLALDGDLERAEVRNKGYFILRG